MHFQSQSDDATYIAPKDERAVIGSDGLLIPPYDLAFRVGGVADPEGFIQVGQMVKEHILQALPMDFTFENKRIFEFGCGVGRVLRHFIPEAREKGCEVWGCDIDMPSVLWMNEHMSPPFNIFHNSENAHLPLEDNYFDLVFAISVFTHLNTTWNQWLAELRRVLKPGGYAFYTFLHRRPFEMIYQQPFIEDEIGMLVKSVNNSWDNGGPNVFLSVDWLKKNWGNLYDIEFIALGGLGDYQSIAFMRKPVSNAPRQLVEPQVVQAGALCALNPHAQAEIYEIYPPNRRFMESYGVRGKGRLPLGGWIAFKNDAVASLSVSVDGKQVLALDKSQLKAEGEKPGWPGTPLYWFSAPLELSDLESGTYTLRVDFVSQTGSEYWAERPLIIEP